MKPVYITIDQVETGRRIKELMDEHNLKVRDLRDACGFEQPQAIYKWINGQSLPSIENLIILSEVFGISINSFLVTVGGASFFLSINNVTGCLRNLGTVLSTQ